MTDWTNADQLLRTWARRARESQIAHYKSANRHRTKDRWLGVPAIILSTIVGTSVFALTEGGRTRLANNSGDVKHLGRSVNDFAYFTCIQREL